MASLLIKDMYLGKIDGYNEFLEYGQDTCKGLFLNFQMCLLIRYLMVVSIIYLEIKELEKQCYLNI